MADYSKWKVTELKAELKRRGVPQTGLKLKQDFINKLSELDSELQAEPPSENAEHDKNAAQENNKKIESEKPREDEITASQQSTTESLPTEKASSPQQEELPQVAPGLESTAKSDGTAVQADQANQAERVDKPHPSEPSPSEIRQPGASDALAEEHEGDSSAQPQDLKNEEIITSEHGSVEVRTTTEPSPSAASEIVSDLRKRKRRSQSPPPSAETIKKSKIDNQSPQVILEEDVVPQASHRSEELLPVASPEAGPTQPEQLEISEDRKEARRRLAESLEKKSTDVSPERRDHRFRELLSADKKRKHAPSPEPSARDVDPPLHPATSALYIRNLMRPLQPVSLKNHLVSLASSAAHGNDSEDLLDFFLDPIKTHCLALFSSASVASRVRSKIHGAVWPNERDRKPLWADFIPDNKLGDWVKTEQESTSGSRASTRWEVVYETTDSGVEAILQEAHGINPGPTPHVPATRQSNDVGAQRDKQFSEPSTRQRGGEGFKALDERFLSTKTKPKLYYLPVSRDVIDKRLNKFACLSRRGSQGGPPGVEDMRRITFEDLDVFVDGGPEYGLGRNRGGRRSGRGSWRGRPR